jgi:hypothetical protein
VGAKPQRRGGPQPDAALRSEHSDAESEAKEKLNYPDIADEVLVEETSIGHARYEFISQLWRDEHEEPVQG